MQRIGRIIVCLVAALALGAAARAGSVERWHVVEMMGAKAGWMRTAEVALDDGGYRSESEMRFKIARGPVEIAIRLETQFVETAAGAPVSMRVVQEFGPTPVVSEFVFHDDHVAVKTTQGGRVTESREALPPEGWLTPRQTDEATRRLIAEGADEITLTILDPSMGLTPIELTRVRGEAGSVRAMGKTVAATRWTVSQSLYPGMESVEWLDDDAHLVRGATDMGGISMEILASEREIALADAAPPEIMASTLVKPDRSIQAPRELERAEYIVRVPKGEMPELPGAGAQRFERIDERAGRVTVEAARTERVPAGFDRAPYLASSSMIGADDPEIIRFVGVQQSDRDKAAIAEELRRLVHRHIDKKSLDVGLASASDVVRTREGDCSEHAALLAAALRAAGIPSRVVSGAIYVDEFLGAEGVFGYHMWTQALLPTGDGGEAWVDLDATLDASTPFDAAHIAMSVSALADGEMVNSMATLAPLLGRLQVEVVEVHADAAP